MTILSNLKSQIFREVQLTKHTAFKLILSWQTEPDQSGFTTGALNTELFKNHLIP